MPKFLPKRDLNYNVKLVNFLGLNVIENPDKTQLTSSSFSIPLKFAFSLLMTFFSLFSGALCISFSRYSPFYLSLFPISFTLLLPYSAYFSVLSNSLSRLSRLVLRLSLLALISHSVSFFHSKHRNTNLFPPVDKASALPVLLLCNLITNCKILRITIQLQPHQYDFPLKTRIAN